MIQDIEDGYYLSTYLHIDPLSNLVGARIRHDHNMSLWKKNGNKVELIHYWEIERLTGLKKHNKSLFSVEKARDMINELLSEYELCLEDIIDIWGTPELQKNKNLEYHSLHDYPQITYHSIAHLFSSLMLDTNIFRKNTIIGLAVDGGPDNVIDCNARSKKYYSSCVAEKGEIKDLFYISSPALLWSYARMKYDMEQGSLMALASASTSEYLLNFPDVVVLDDRLSSKTAFEWFNKLHSTIENLDDRDVGVVFNGFDERFSIEDNKISMVMKLIQKKSELMMINTIHEIIQKYNIQVENTYLAISGGYALNCVSNSMLMQQFHFKGFLAPPCVSDTGQSLGIALYAFNKYVKSFDFRFDHPYYGNEDTKLEQLLLSDQWKPFIKSVSDLELNTIVNDLKHSPIVWFDGRSEVGPRALGSRSILADPRWKESKDILNVVKQRQWWRPVAPIILEECLDEWFESAYQSPYMLQTFKIRADKLPLIPAISHIDTSSRIQTLNSENNQLLYNVLKAFYSSEKVPILCNTSLNDKGEPIIDKIPEALNFVLRKRIKCLYVNGIRIEVQNFDEYPECSPLKRNMSYYSNSNKAEEEQRIQQYNPYDISAEMLEFYYATSRLNNSLDIEQKRDVDKMKRLFNIIHKNELITD